MALAGRGRLSSQRTAQASVCPEGRESETGRGGGSEREVVAKTALPTWQFCQGPRLMPSLPPETVFHAAGRNLLMPELIQQDCSKFRNLQALPVSSAGTGLPSSGFSSSAKVPLVCAPARFPARRREGGRERRGIKCIWVPPSQIFVPTSSFACLQVRQKSISQETQRS